MKRHAAIALSVLLLSGCATFKELKPDPELSPLERGYIELRNDKDQFDLEQDGKYFIKFPGPTAENFDLVLVTNAKPVLHTYLTSKFDDGKGTIAPIPDEAQASDSISVYRIDPRFPWYYWVIDAVKQDVILFMHYRYVPRWRYTFETKYAAYQQTLERNTVVRETYEAIDQDYNVDGIDASRELKNLKVRSGALSSLRSDLRELESVFPPNIASSGDTAYRNYVALTNRLDDELTFQKNYGDALTFFQADKQSRGDAGAFVEASPTIAKAVAQPDRFPSPLAARIRTSLGARLAEVGPFYENLLRNKTNLTRITPEPTPEVMADLYRSAGKSEPPEQESLYRFVRRFNVESAGVQSVQEKLASLKTYFSRNVSAQGESFYRELVNRTGQIKEAIPEPIAARTPGYGNSTSAVAMGEEISRLTGLVNDHLGLYKGALDVQGLVTGKQWPPAEAGLRQMFEDRSYRDSKAILDERNLLVRRLENDLVTGVRTASEQRVNAFVRDHEMTIDNVPALYQDSVFMPVYQLTFSSYGPSDLAQKREQIDGYLGRMKYYLFPESAIKAIYKDLMRNLGERGVDKARAIVEHGKNYRGDDKLVKAYVTECSPALPKWIQKPKEYRKVLVLPVTSNARGANEYLFRIRLQIPTEAQFPVYDINIKLPPEVAEKAGTAQWYDEISINKKPLKNEGRFRITSPLPSNNYESLITPVQMDKDGNNILEVRFRYPGYRVFEVSAMAQVPIIRKN